MIEAIKEINITECSLYMYNKRTCKYNTQLNQKWGIYALSDSKNKSQDAE